VTLRICTRAAIILSTDTEPAPAIFADVKALYDLRSSLAHGAIITQNEQLIDRLRDLARRSILMRLEQQVLDLRQELEERTDDLDASRAANRDLMTVANRKPAMPG